MFGCRPRLSPTARVVSAPPRINPPALTSLPLLQAQKVSDDLMQKISSQNRRALDLVVAKCYYYHSRIYEFLNKLDVVRRWDGACRGLSLNVIPLFSSLFADSLSHPAASCTPGSARPRCATTPTARPRS